LPDFYRRCDVVVNPVAWGTGLKIKTIEALAFHRPVLASEHAGSHLEAIESGVLTCRDPQSWIDCLQTLATRPEQLERLQHQARNYARRALSPAAVYGDLAQQLQQLSQQKKAEPTQS
jgi:glycosyltransferase involved in cell wall biosynthesis